MLRRAAVLLIAVTLAAGAAQALQTTPPAQPERPSASSAPVATPQGGRATLGRITLGFVLASAGAVAFILALVYKGPVWLTLFSFGMFSFLYGVRILISVPAIAQLLGVSRRSIVFSIAWINYVLPGFGLLFAEQIRGRGWKSSLRVAWIAAFIMAASLMAVDLARGYPWSGLPVYRMFLIVTMLLLLAHLLWWHHTDRIETAIRTVGTGVLAIAVIHDNVTAFLPWNVSLEVYGLSVFILALGVVTARRFFADQRELAAVEREMAMARTIQASILPRELPALAGARFAVRYLPARTVAGDVYDFIRLNDSQMGILVADVAGHGVPAALIASMATVAFSSQRGYAADPGRTLSEINRVICGHFDARYVTAAYVVIDTAAQRARYSLAGHPPPLLVRASTRELVELTRGSTVLGLFEDATFPTAEVDFQAGDRLVLYTDGLTDVSNAADDWFGHAELKSFVRESAALSPEQFLDALIDRVARWSAAGTSQFEDDLTVVVVDAALPSQR